MKRTAGPLPGHLMPLRGQLFAQDHPRRYGILLGLLLGLSAGAFVPLPIAALAPGVPLPGLVVAGVGAGVLFSLLSGVLATRTCRKVVAEAAEHTEPERFRAAQRLVRSGHPGEDPETNRTARLYAERLLSPPHRPGVVVLFLAAVAVSGVSAALSHHQYGPNTWFALQAYNTGMMAWFLCVHVLTTYRRNRALDLLIATDPPRTEEVP